MPARWTILAIVLFGSLAPSALAQGEGDEPAYGNEPPNGLEHALFPEPDRPLRVRYDDGFVLSTADDFLLLRIGMMAQMDGKLFLPSDQDPARSGAYLPRVRTYFSGQLGPSWEYEISLQRSVEGTIDILDSSLNYKFQEWLQLKTGRFLVPYSFDWYDHLEEYFIAPERGLFPLNFGLSREAGVMLWGNLGEDQGEYAFGGFSGRLAGLADTNDTQDMVGYVNLRPFRQGQYRPLRFFNVGGSFAIGRQAFAAEPLSLRTSIQSSENDEAAQAASAIFLDFLPEVVALGNRSQQAIHTALYSGGLSLEAEWASGQYDYRNAEGQTVRLPVDGYHVTTGYFITGEEVERRETVVPLRPFDPGAGQWGTGAVEPFFRVSRLALGGEVFRGSLADRDEWTNAATAFEVGWNWYPTRYVKFYFDWQRSNFASPVLINRDTGRFSRTNDLLWVRAQIRF